jgi:hypothetical protein
MEATGEVYGAYDLSMLGWGQPELGDAFSVEVLYVEAVGMAPAEPGMDELITTVRDKELLVPVVKAKNFPDRVYESLCLVAGSVEVRYPSLPNFLFAPLDASELALKRIQQ